VPDLGVIPYGEIDVQNPKRHLYSRYTQDVSTRAEKILSVINVRIVPSLGSFD
jgi:hypothetical protein